MNVLRATSHAHRMATGQAGPPVDSVGSPPPETQESRERQGLGFFHGVGSGTDKLNVHLEGEDYQNISKNEGARMLGHFTQVMLLKGFPWKLHDAKPTGDGNFKRGSKISEMDALTKLAKGEPVMMQPMRKLVLDLSAGSIGALAAGATTAGAAELAGVSQAAAFSKNAQVSAGSQGFLLRYGEPTVVSNMGELKLLYQMFNPDEKIKGKSAVAQAAHQFSHFTERGGQYPWRFYVKDGSNTFLRVSKAVAGQGAYGAAMGSLAGGFVGAVFTLFSGDFNLMTTVKAAGIGAAVGATYTGWNAARTSVKGRDINAVEALERVLGNDEVVFQQTEARTAGLPVITKISFFQDYNEGSSISNPDELEQLYYMHSQAELPKPKKEEKKKEEPAPTQINIDQSSHVHYHVGQERRRPTPIPPEVVIIPLD